jgi:c-di-GMP-binding flagellar brake protein YcgR
MKRLTKKPMAGRQPKPTEGTLAEKLKIAEELRDLQEKLAPLRAANKAERAKSKVQIHIKTR